MQLLADEGVGDEAGVVAPLQVPEGQGAVQQGQGGSVLGQFGHGVGQPLHLAHGAERTQQRARDENLVGGVVGTAQIEVLVIHGQGWLAEHPAVGVLAVDEGAAAQVDEVAAQGQVAVHVDVGAVHGQRAPVAGRLRRGDAGQHPLGGRCGRRCRDDGPPRRCDWRPRRRLR